MSLTCIERLYVWYQVNTEVLEYLRNLSTIKKTFSFKTFKYTNVW